MSQIRINKHIFLVFISIIAVLSVLVLIFNRNDDFAFNKEDLKLFPNIDLNELDEEFFSEQRNYIFIDLGANRGDSINRFFGKEQNELPSILDSNLVNRANWTIYAFEPNPAFEEDLFRMKNSLAPKHTVHLYNRSAGWIYDGTINFYIDAKNRDFVGSSLKINHPDVKNGKISINVTCYDIAKFLQKFSKNDFVVLKVDIEGAEYELFTHLIVKNTIGLIDLMPIEYHKYLSKFKTPEQVFNYIFQASGTKVFKWV